MPRDAAVDHVMVSADSANTSTARDVSCDERTPWSSNSESSPHYVPQPGKEKRLNKTGRQENTAASPSGPLTEAQLTSSAEAVTRPLPSNCSTPRKQQITSPPPPPPAPRKSCRMIILLNCRACRSKTRLPQRKERHRFVRIAVRLTIGPLTSLVTWHGYGVSCWISADLRRR